MCNINFDITHCCHSIYFVMGGNGNICKEMAVLLIIQDMS